MNAADRIRQGGDQILFEHRITGLSEKGFIRLLVDDDDAAVQTFDGADCLSFCRNEFRLDVIALQPLGNLTRVLFRPKGEAGRAQDRHSRRHHHQQHNGFC